MNNFRYIALMLIAVVMMSGCTKMLNPAGHSEFSCSDPDNGICGSVDDIYSNRQDIEAYKNEKAYSSMPDIKDYIERECGNELMMGNNDTYDMCARDAKDEYKKRITSIKQKVSEQTQFPISTGKYMEGILQAKEGIPLRQPEKVSRIWFAPYQNDMGDLVYSHFVYVVEDRSNWLFAPEDEARDMRDRAVPMRAFTTKVK
jgi:type IV conjugative transfer system lipoprotein TraV